MPWLSVFIPFILIDFFKLVDMVRLLLFFLLLNHSTNFSHSAQHSHCLLAEKAYSLVKYSTRIIYSTLKYLKMQHYAFCSGDGLNFNQLLEDNFCIHYKWSTDLLHHSLSQNRLSCLGWDYKVVCQIWHPASNMWVGRTDE